MKRKLNVLRGALGRPAPTTAGAAAELNEIATKLQSDYGKGKGTLNGQPINGSDIEAAMGTNRRLAQLKEMWVSWHDNVGKLMKADYVCMVDIANKGAVEQGYDVVGTIWRTQYELPADEFEGLPARWTELRRVGKGDVSK